MVLSAADALLAPVTDMEGFLFACLVDSSTGMVAASVQDRDRFTQSSPAVTAADIAHVLSLLTGCLAFNDRLEDVIVTFSDHFHMIRPVGPDAAGSGREVLLLVILDRQRANLAMARREIRLFCESLAA